MATVKTDTKEEPRRIQQKVMTSAETAMNVIEMTEAAYREVRINILNANPGISNGELVALIFERYYANGFTPEKLQEINEAIVNFHRGANAGDNKY
jgi:uncharacterized membrane protein